MHSDDLGPAMALSEARDAGNKAVERMAAAAAEVAAQIRRGAFDLEDVHDHTAALNGASAWERFAQLLGWRPPVAPPVRDVRSTFKSTVETDSYDGGDMGTLTGGPAFGGAGGDFGGAGATGAWD